ncbi:sugar ABC transporter permease [Antarcticimicrobium sediminis]|uniref:Sugar ABC transporter permease n=2 Tax=Antarcticimicrobium sediminis TaxID=2546227 RepID=A0A4R5EL04_9RHOB|nr:sugar ABC transporter permease [Antarcticimicrobium sediminis]
MIFLAPVMLVLMLVAVFPILYSLYLSFFRIKLTRPNRTPFVWLDNYTDLFGNELFWTSVARTVVFSVVSVSAIAVIALLVSLLLNQDFRFRRVLSTIILVPWAIPYVANALMWKWIYDSGYGALNGLLFQLDFISRYMVFLGDQNKTIYLIANAFVWKEVPLATILLLVSLKAIPSDLYAAARVDGATVWSRFVHVTLPAMKPGFLLVMIYETMMAIRHFDLFFILTEGGPGDASHVLSWHIYVETFRNLSFGSGAAMSYVLALVTFALSYIFIRTLGRRV